MKTLITALACALAASLPAVAEIKTATVTYHDGETTLEGYVAYDDAVPAPRPGIVVVHDWTGLGDYAKSRARQLAALGYTAFAADIYGKGIRPTDPAEAGKTAGVYKNDLPLLRRRVTLAYDQLKAQPGVDAARLGAIGYCFGGTTVLELGRSGAPLKAIVTFHGGLATKLPAQPGKVSAQILVCHGADDPYVKPAEVAAFQDEMKTAGVKMDLITYPGAVHSFSNPAAGSDVSKGNAYNEAADKASWTAMKDFFAAAFK